MKTTHTDNLSLDDALFRLQPNQAPNRSDMASVNNCASEGWDLNTPFDRAVYLATHGWQERVEEVEACMRLVQQLVSDSWGASHDVAGDAVDVGAFLDGTPECMISFHTPKRQSVNMVVSISASASADAPRLFNRGIAIAAAVYALQCAGTPVSLRVFESCTSGGERFNTSIEVNPFGNYLDPARLAFWLSHPAALRRCFFRYQEQAPTKIRETFGFHCGGGYGKPADPPKDSEEIRDSVYVPFPTTESLSLYQTPHKAFETIAAILAERGVSIHRRG